MNSDTGYTDITANPVERGSRMTQKISTRVNQILGSEYPLMVGTMGWYSNAELVAAAANAGAFACIASSLHDTSQSLREEIRKAKSLTDKPFGVNFNLFPQHRPPNLEEYIDTVLEEGVGVIETAGRSPEEFVDRIKKGNARLMHKCARVRDARKAEGVGADIVEIVGFECGGHPSREGIGSIVLIPQVVDAVQIPVIAGGGLSDARGFVAALALGAEGVLMGTRFLLAHECPIPLGLKKRLVDATSTETMLILSTLGDPARVLGNELMMKVCGMEEKGASLEELLPLLSGVRSQEAMAAGDFENCFISCGQCIGLIDDISSMKEIISGVIAETEAIYAKLGNAMGGRSQ